MSPGTPWQALAALALIGITWLVAAHVANRRARHVRWITPRPPNPGHRCKLPWRRPFRKLGERVQCLACGMVWRWDRYYWAPGDSSLIWINEREEAEQAEIAEQAKRNAH